MYQLTSHGTVTRKSDGASIPIDPENGDYRDFLSWVESGGVPDPSPITALSQAKADKIMRVNSACDAAINAIKATYPDAEVLSWPKQEAEARAYLADITADVPLLNAIASARGIPVTDLATRILSKSAAFAAYSGAAIGIRQLAESAINAAETIEQLESVA